MTYQDWLKTRTYKEGRISRFVGCGSSVLVVGLMAKAVGLTATLDEFDVLSEQDVLYAMQYADSHPASTTRYPDFS